nr:ferritin-like domain-containing protein [Acidimicrobiia bacterium]
MTSPPASYLDLGDLGLDRGGHLLLKRALAAMVAGDVLDVTGGSQELPVHLRAWCRAQGHRLDWPPDATA